MKYLDLAKCCLLRHAQRGSAFFTLFILGGLLVACQRAQPRKLPAGAPPAGVVPVQVVRSDSGFQLLRGGKPYYIKGAAGLSRYAELRQAGANSVRLWSTDYAEALLDEAQRNGLTVTLGLWMLGSHDGIDYFDKEAVRQQKEYLRRQVLRFRRHPALLMWDLGNEMDLMGHTPRDFQALNDVARMIHELDPYHPVTTSMTGHMRGAPVVIRFCPDLDLLSVNSFKELMNLPHKLDSLGWKGPYLLTEYGTPGYWEEPRTSWGAALEPTSTRKAQKVQELYQGIIQAHRNQCLGSYVFYWGQKFEYTSTWFSMFSPSGEKTELVDISQYLWTQQWPANRAPRVEPLQLAGGHGSDNLRLRPNQTYPARIAAADPEGDSLTADWQIEPDMPYGNLTPDQVRTAHEPWPGSVQKGAGLQTIIKTPNRAGLYRLYVTVRDGKGSVATANVPFKVSSADVANGKPL